MGGIGPAAVPSTGSGQEQQFALKWNDFHQSIITSFRHLRDEEDFIDVTIACDGCSFMAHKVVLSACSPYFRSLLKANPCQHPIVILQDVREHDMEALLRFMYNGEVHIGQDQLPDFLKTAQTLQVRGLADVSSKDQHKLSNMSSSIPWSSGDDNTHSQSLYNSKHSLSTDDQHQPSKRLRTNENQNQQNSRYSVSPPMNRESSGSENADNKPSSLSDSVLSQQSQGDRPHSAQNSHPVQSSNEESDFEDEASDAEVTDNGHSNMGELVPPAPDFALSDRSRSDSLVNPLFDPQRQRGGYAPIPFNFQELAGILPGLSGMHNNSQDNYVSVTSGCGGVPGGGTGSSACYAGLAEPKPICKECGRVYSSISNLKQHIANVHSTAPQWEPCPICGKHFKTKQYLFNHLLQTHGIRQRGNRMPIMPFSGSGSGYASSSSSPSPSSSHHSHHHATTSATSSSSGPGPSHHHHQHHPSSSVSVTRIGSSAPPLIFPSPPPPPPPPPSSSLVAAMSSPSAPAMPPPPAPAPSSSVGAAVASPVGPHSPMERSMDRTMPHQATPSSSAAVGQKDRDMSSAVEQCLHYLSSSSK